jgi:hypothetical protein
MSDLGAAGEPVHCCHEGVEPNVATHQRWSLAWMEKIMSKWTIRTCAVTLTAVAMVTVAGAPASALPISENIIRRECRLANGVYHTQVITNNVTKLSTRFSTCSYRDINGTSYTDYYADGDYYSTQP